MDNFFTLLLGILFTALSYMAVPLLGLMINCGRYEKTKAKKIALWNSIIVGFIYLFLTSALTDKVWKASPAFFYYWINCAILTKKPIPTGVTMSNTEKAQSDIQHSFSREEERQPSVLTDHHRKPYLEELISNAAPTAQEPVNNDAPKAPTPSQEFLLQEIQKKLKQQEINHLSQSLYEKGKEFKKAKRTRATITILGVALGYFALFAIVCGDAFAVVVYLIMSIIFSGIHFWAHTVIFGYLTRKGIEESEKLDSIKKRISELEKNLKQ